MTTTTDSQPHVMLSAASARIARLPIRVAMAILRRASNVMIGIARMATISPASEKRLAFAGPQAPPCANNDVTGEGKQQGPADLAGGAFDMLGKGLAVAKLDAEAPDQYAGRRQLDQAIKPEGHQCETASRNAGAEGYAPFGDHPADRQPFESERFAD